MPDLAVGDVVTAAPDDDGRLWAQRRESTGGHGTIRVIPLLDGSLLGSTQALVSALSQSPVSYTHLDVYKRQAYMGSDPAAPFVAAGLDLVWSDHQMSTGDSIVSVLLDEDDPMSIVLARHPH